MHLLEEHIGFDEIISVYFHCAFYASMERDPIDPLESFILAQMLQKLLVIPNGTLLTPSITVFYEKVNRKMKNAINRPALTGKLEKLEKHPPIGQKKCGKLSFGRKQLTTAQPMCYNTGYSTLTPESAGKLN